MIICEIGQNHCGDMKLAKYLIKEAKDNGGDLVKFQLYDHNILYRDHPEIPDVALSYRQAKDLFEYGREVGIEVFFSVFDVEKVKWCERIGVKRYKIAYSQNDNINLWEEIIKTRKAIIISCLPPYTVPKPYKYKEWIDIKFLHCVPKYPAPLDGLEFPDHFEIGFSDHTIGLDAAKIALARGAEIIEKHFAIDHHTGIDAEWSMTPDELAELKRWETVCKEVL